jgi:hypothetical protein
MENEESADQPNTTDDRTPIENEEKVPGKTDNPWKHDIFDDTYPSPRKEPKDPKRTFVLLAFPIFDLRIVPT